MVPFDGRNRPVADKRVVIYSMPTWPHCKKAKEYLSEKNIKYKEYDVSADQKAVREMYEKTNQLGVPVIIVDDNDIMVGFDPAKLDEWLDAAD